MVNPSLEFTIDAGWDLRESITPDTGGDIAKAVNETMQLLDEGAIRVASPTPDGRWQVHQWIKKAVLLWFRLTPNDVIRGGPVDPVHGDGVWWDKVRPNSPAGRPRISGRAGFRAVPGAIAPLLRPSSRPMSC